MMSFFSHAISAWFLQNARDLPWRNFYNPYFTWISEIILQQTRVEQGLPYYHKFIERFPQIEDLAAAHLEEVLKIWQGLGYYSRARNMHKCAQIVVEKYQGSFPNNYTDLLALPGIGPYTAAAIASICFDEKVAVVDGNVQRLVARYLGMELAVNEKQGSKIILDFVNQEVLATEPAIFNQAMMEMGSLVCKPNNPNCANCPLAQQCYALKWKKTHVLPLKTKKMKVTDRFLNYFVILKDNKVQIYQRNNESIWASLYEFPMIETQDSKEFEQCVLLGEVKHILSHQRIYAKLWKVIGEIDSFSENSSIFEVEMNEIKNYPVHQLMKKMIILWQE